MTGKAGIATLLAWLSLAAGSASAQGVGASLDVETIVPQKLSQQSVYMTKLLCGTIPADPTAPQAPAGALLAPGTYLSRVNIHFIGLKGPQNFDVTVSAGGLLQVSTRILQPFGTAVIDCGSAIPDFDPLGPFVERAIGVLTVLAPNEAANVVAIYTFKNVEPDSPRSAP
jgi:hypothetical protein